MTASHSRFRALLMVGLLLLTRGAGADSGGSPGPGTPRSHDVARQLPAILNGFESVVRRTLGEERIPGAAWVVVHDGAIAGLGTHGHADRQRNRVIDPSTAFRIASVSKGFAGVLAALLAQEGHFGLTDPIAPYAPSFGFRNDQVRTLSVQDVLGQRSGFVPNAYDNLIEAGRLRQDIYPRFAEIDPICPPGTCYSYQNSIFSLIEDVIERSTAVPYPDLVEERLFAPLGMDNASLGYDAFIAESNRADPHLKTRTGWRRSSPRRTYYQVSSAAGINASIRDMAQWALAMLGHRPEVIPAPVINEVLTPRIRTVRELRNRHWRDRLENAHYGLGWRIYELAGHELAIHSGWLAGYRAEIALSRQLDLGLVILMNAESRSVGELDRAFWDLVPVD